MTNFACIIRDVAVDVSAIPEDQFHPDIAKDFVQVPDAVRPGWARVDGGWQAPEAALPDPLAVAPAPVVSPVDFMPLFTSPERVAIKALRQTDPIIDDFFDIAEDPRLTAIHLDAKTTVDAVSYFAAKGLVTAGRKDEILAGVKPS